MEDFKTLVELWEIYKVAILVSLVGALIGHYKRNSCILLPIVSIDYKFKDFKRLKRKSYSTFKKGLMGLLITLKAFVYFVLYLVGIRFGDNKDTDPILFELGVIGDLIIGIGAGVIAQSTIIMSGAHDQLSVVVTALLAGFAGLSYIQKFQKESLDHAGIEYRAKLAQAEEYAVQIKKESSSNQEVAATREKI
ncbi:hypothetical protein [Pontibacillus yanchengensis]|uniref:Uncharacterized protein n=1 Tax=Pontibacillus yanchengensis Y32 TaxID=1385514 RepID=A0A0A2TH24_9BACI|nr:hypothetical protein [Pontibacillus yanchengensis]KGP73366.1 hypothetical protein N782_05700 [Pontibacillus yanchengensis Y32]